MNSRCPRLRVSLSPCFCLLSHQRLGWQFSKVRGTTIQPLLHTHMAMSILHLHFFHTHPPSPSPSPLFTPPPPPPLPSSTTHRVSWHDVYRVVVISSFGKLSAMAAMVWTGDFYLWLPTVLVLPTQLQAFRGNSTSHTHTVIGKEEDQWSANWPFFKSPSRKFCPVWWPSQ